MSLISKYCSELFNHSTRGLDWVTLWRSTYANRSIGHLTWYYKKCRTTPHFVKRTLMCRRYEL